MSPHPFMFSWGFTLIEVLIVVAILGILSTVGIPIYVGYIDTSRAKHAQHNLQAVFMQQEQYYSNNNSYYSTGIACGDNAVAINTTLFSGKQIIQDDFYTYCILQVTVNDYTIQAVEIGGGNTFTLDQNRNINF